MSIVAISESLGSLADEIGRELARVLGYEFANREIVAKAAERYGESVLDLAHVTEERPTLWERLSDTKRRYLHSVEAIILEMASRDNVVLAGRSATILLSGVRHTLRARITAPEGVRAQRLEQRQGLTPEAALDLVRHTDRERAARVKFLYHVDWEDPLLYDVVVNTERVGVEAAARLLRETLGEPRFQPTADSVREVTDRSVVAQVRAAVLAHPLTRYIELSPTCKNGYLSISGVVDQEEQRDAVKEVIAAIPGITGVLNEVMVTHPTRRPPPPA